MKRRGLLLAASLFLLSVSAHAGVTTEQAIRDGCYSSPQINAMYDKAIANITASVTREKLNDYFPPFPDDTTTKTKVTASNTWVFRATDVPWQIRKLEEEVLYSKAQHRVDKIEERGGDVKAFWDMNGPKLDASDDQARNATFLMMRLLSIQTSDTPPSQFVSVALTYDVASAFGNIVYAFQVDPNSVVLGLRDCRLGGEDQLQILGGTKIQNLHRKQRGKKWEKYDPATGRWSFVNYKIPPQ